jgi:hypothetical protein
MPGTRLPFAKFFATDWMGDAKLQRASLRAKGAWIQILAHMWHDGAFQISGTVEEFATTILHCPIRDAGVTLREIGDAGIAEVTTRGERICVMSRRLKREHDKRKGWRDRKKRQREGTD